VQQLHVTQLIHQVANSTGLARVSKRRQISLDLFFQIVRRFNQLLLQKMMASRARPQCEANTVGKRRGRRNRLCELQHALHTMQSWACRSTVLCKLPSAYVRYVVQRPAQPQSKQPGAGDGTSAVRFMTVREGMSGVSLRDEQRFTVLVLLRVTRVHHRQFHPSL
jgi:hypothetical protein